MSFIRTKFLDALQEYQRVEQDHRTKSRVRVERQYRIGSCSPSRVDPSDVCSESECNTRRGQSIR